MMTTIHDTAIPGEDQPDEYDSPWKAAIEQFFPEFMAFYFPAAHTQIDWTQPYEFLDQELIAVVRDAELGKRLVDKLVKVTGINGNEDWLYVHIEVQGNKQTEFAKRMFVYNYRLFDRYDKPIASMAILADDSPDWKPDHFSFEALGCRHTLEFPIAKLSDYGADMEGLLSNQNPFALITAAHLLTKRTKGKPQERFEAKRKLAQMLYDRAWEKQQIIDLLFVLDWMMWLPDYLSEAFRQEVHEIEEVKDMNYVTSFEKLSRKEGLQEGLQQGVQQGRQEGESVMLRLMLTQRFGELPAEADARLKGASEDQLRLWGTRLFSAATLGDVFRDATH